MEKSKRNSIIALAAVGTASALLGYYLSKKENREKIKENIYDTSVRFLNKIDELEYKYEILPCDEAYSWNKENGEITCTIKRKAKSIEEDF